MKAVLMSIKPDWFCYIANGKKTLEIRRNRPAIEPPFKVYLYCTKAKNKGDVARLHLGEEVQEVNGKVVAEFICDNIRRFDVPYPAYQNELDPEIRKKSCLTYYQLHRYAYHDDLYAWNISDLVVYDKPKELTEFSRFGAMFCGCVCLNRNCDNYVESVCYDEPPECRITDCTLYRPPQSWCYVEELENG